LTKYYTITTKYASEYTWIRLVLGLHPEQPRELTHYLTPWLEYIYTEAWTGERRKTWDRKTRVKVPRIHFLVRRTGKVAVFCTTLYKFALLL